MRQLAGAEMRTPISWDSKRSSENAGTVDLSSWVPRPCFTCWSEDGPRSLQEINPGKPKKTRNGRRLDPEVPTETDRRMIAEVYAEDFKRFGYSLETSMPLHADASAAPRPVKPRRRSGMANTLGRLQSRLTRLLRT